MGMEPFYGYRPISYEWSCDYLRCTARASTDPRGQWMPFGWTCTHTFQYVSNVRCPEHKDS